MKPAKQNQQKFVATKSETAAKLTNARQKQSVRAKYSMYVFPGPDPFLMILTDI